MSDLVGAEEYSGRKAIAIVLCALFVITAFTGLSMNSSASTLTVRVRITEIQGIDWVDDSPNYPDFYWKVTLGTSTVATADPYSTDLNHIYPNWDAYFYGLNAGGGQSYTLTIELWDDDGSGTASDDICDISRYAGGGVETTPRSSQAVMTYSIDTSTWIGDDGFSGDPNGVGHVSGEEDLQSGDYDDCEVWFVAVTIPNNTPIATIDSISPNPANVGTTVSFSGHGTDYDGSIVAYNWRTSTTTLSTAASFTKSDFAVGTYRIYFKVLDDDGGWSSEVYRDLTVISNAAPTATISSISPNPASWGTSVSFSGYGTDTDGTITGYNWRSGSTQLSTAASFSTSSLSAGSHTIYFKVMDDDGVWSTEVTRTLTVNAVPMDVKVTITRVTQIDKVDSGSNAADFYWKVTLAGSTQMTSDPWVANNNDIYPNWVASWTLNAGNNLASSLVIELWDDDGAGTADDDLCDIDIGAGIGTAAMTYYIDTNSWTGDDASAGDANGAGHVSGNEDGSTATDQDDCELWFTITRTAPNTPPIAVIDSISPNPASLGQTVIFNGHGTDVDGSVVAWNWRSNLDGQLSTAEDFSTTALSVGTHSIYYKVQDEDGAWSSETSTTQTITGNTLPALDVRVTITHVRQIDKVDSNGGADFYWKVTLSGDIRQSIEPWAKDSNDIYPGWSSVWTLPAGSGQSYTLVIELWDDDDTSSPDDPCDIAIGAGIDTAVMTYNIDMNSWTGDDSSADADKGHVSGNEDGSTSSDEDDCELWFTIQTGAPADTDGDGVLDSQDINPDQDLCVKLIVDEIKEIDSMDSGSTFDPFVAIRIGDGSDATLDGDAWKSEIWSHSDVPIVTSPRRGVYSGDYVLWKNVADDQRYVTIQIEVWDDDSKDLLGNNNPGPDTRHTGIDDLADISRVAGGGDEANPGGSILHLTYDLMSGTWSGDDSNVLGGWDASPGFTSGEEDGSAADEDDCSLKFSIVTAFEISKSSKQYLSDKYSPTLFFSDYEAYFPIDVMCMIDQSDLVRKSDSVVLDASPISLQSLVTYRTTSYINQPPDTPQTGYANQILAQVFTSDNNRIVLEYWFFYIYNDGDGFAPAHEGDWEMIALVFAVGSYDSYLGGSIGTLIPEYACYSQHYTGEKRAWADVQKNGNHPKVFVTQGGHPSYFTGAESLTKSFALVLMSPGPWLNYAGVWGASEWSVPGPVYRCTIGGIIGGTGDPVGYMWHEPCYWSNELP